MPMVLESTSREAFELVTDALEFIDEYRESRETRFLKAAKEKLKAAKENDPEYFSAHYYDAIVDDLDGRSTEAIKTLQLLEKEHTQFQSEILYNHAVAEYHHYNHEALDRALALFNFVSEKDDAEIHIRLLADAGMAQAHAMHMIPKNPAEPNLIEIEDHFKRADVISEETLKKLNEHKRGLFSFGRPGIDQEIVNEVEWTCHNAQGMARMYRSDYLPSNPESAASRKDRIKQLKKAIKMLNRAAAISPRNWANQCDMASARMRLGYYSKDGAYFDRANALLNEVVKDLRPGYGFARYEQGRILRLRGLFEEAFLHFKKVISLPIEERYDISDRRLNIEKDRAEAKDKSFP